MSSRDDVAWIESLASHRLVRLLEVGTATAKAEASGALIALAAEHATSGETAERRPNQHTIAARLVALLAAGPDDAAEAVSSAGGLARVEACECATRLLCTLSLDADHREALDRAGAVTQLVRQLKGGSESSQTMAACALPQLARLSSEMRIQVVQQLVQLLSSESTDVRQRAGNTLRVMTVRDKDGGADVDAAQRAAAMAGGVAPLVALLKDGLADGRVEAQARAISRNLRPISARSPCDLADGRDVPMMCRRRSTPSGRSQ